MLIYYLKTISTGQWYLFNMIIYDGIWVIYYFTLIFYLLLVLCAFSFFFLFFIGEGENLVAGFIWCFPLSFLPDVLNLPDVFCVDVSLSLVLVEKSLSLGEIWSIFLFLLLFFDFVNFSGTSCLTIVFLWPLLIGIFLFSSSFNSVCRICRIIYLNRSCNNSWW